jgi:hypothetical protein
MKLLELVLDDGPGLAGDSALDPFPVGAEPEADRAMPAAVAVPVPFAVTAGGSVFEEDAVLAPGATSARGFHGPQQRGPFLGAICQPCGATASDVQP